MSALRHRILTKATSLFLVAVMALVTAGVNTGCYVQKHDVGAGASGAESREFRQWFALWGLVPITDVEDDVEAYYADSTDYTVETGFTPIDVLIGIFTSVVTIAPKTVTVSK